MGSNRIKDAKWDILWADVAYMGGDTFSFLELGELVCMCRVGERGAGVKRAEASFGHCIHLESALLMKI